MMAAPRWMKTAVSLIAIVLLAAVLAIALLAQRGELVGRLKEALGFSTYLAPPDAAATDYRRRRLASFRAESTPADIVLLGDSHIANGDWVSLLPGRKVLNRGIGWDTTEDVLDRLDEVIARKPRIVVIQIGIVDLRYGRDPATVVRNIRAIERVRAVNDALRADPDFVDLHSILVTDGALKSSLTTDGVHLSGDAYALWAQRLAGVLDRPSQ